MKSKITVRCNNDHALVSWSFENIIPGCIGFALYRNRNGKEEIVQNRIGFADGVPKLPAVGTPMLSTKFPIQRFVWTDFDVNDGDLIQYKIVPISIKNDKIIELSELTIKYSKACKVETGKNLKAYFNVGLISSQFFSKLAKDAKGKKLTPKSIVNDKSSNRLREFLGGGLTKKLFSLLDELGKEGETKIIYLALFELEQTDLINKLIKIGKRCNLILANGAANNSEIDKNNEAREIIEKSNINLFDRMVGSGHLSHNKFIIICDSKNNPQEVWTGSTNWTPNGLFGQVNNAILIKDSKLAVEYYNEWQQLKAAKSDYPKMLSEYNSKIKIGKLATTWFNPTPAQGDLADVQTLIKEAKNGILFLMFNPGTKNTLYNSILEIARTTSSLYIRGILNQEPVTKGDKIVSLEKPIRILDKGREIKTDWQTIMPSALKGESSWEDESSIGLVRIHSKVIVIDPFGQNPYVITGSNNLGPKASKTNDDNLNIISDQKLAEEYSVNIMSIYNHYHFRFASKLKKTGGFKGLTKDPNWMKSYLTADRLSELEFWL